MKNKCNLGCIYSRAINQEYPRKCLECGQPETPIREPATQPLFTWNQFENALIKLIKSEKYFVGLDIIIALKQELGLMPKSE